MYICDNELKEMVDSGFARVIPFFDDYMITRDGRVISLKFKGGSKAKIIKDYKHTIGYRQVKINSGTTSKAFYVHRLVAQAFIPNPNNLPIINHIDEDPSNNDVSNLEWCTHSYNINYGGRNKKTSILFSKKVIQIALNGRVVNKWDSVKSATKIGFSSSCIRACATGKYSNHRGFIWLFLDDYESELILNLEIKRRIDRINKEKVHFNSKKVVQMDYEGSEIKIWDSASKAERDGLFNGRKISLCCLGKNKTHKGYKWKFINNYGKE